MIKSLILRILYKLTHVIEFGWNKKPITPLNMLSKKDGKKYAGKHVAVVKIPTVIASAKDVNKGFHKDALKKASELSYSEPTFFYVPEKGRSFFFLTETST